MRRGLAVAAILLAGAAPAAAFDCARAVSQVEKAICGSDEARQANDRMEAAYFSLRDGSGDGARKILLDGQKAWLRYRDDSCGPVAECLSEASARRAEALEAAPAGTVPFMLYQKGVENGYEVTITGYRFAAPADLGEAAYERWVAARIAETPYGQPPEPQDEPHSPWGHELSIDLPRLTARLISAVAYTYDYSGGAHPNSWSNSINLDRASGAALDAATLFGADGLKTLTEACARQIVEHYSDMYEGLGEDEALARLEEDYPGVVAEHVGDMSRWHFDADGGVVRFDSYAVAPYAAGPAECRFDHGLLRPLVTDPGILAGD